MKLSPKMPKKEQKGEMILLKRVQLGIKKTNLSAGLVLWLLLGHLVPAAMMSAMIC